jgi:hypothetical protein
MSFFNHGKSKKVDPNLNTQNLTPHSKTVHEIPADDQADNEENSCRVWTRRFITILAKTPHSFHLLQRESSLHPSNHFFQIHGANRQLRQTGMSIFYSNPTIHYALLIAVICSKYLTTSSPLFTALFYAVQKWEAKAWRVHLVRDRNKWQDLVSKVKKPCTIKSGEFLDWLAAVTSSWPANCCYVTAKWGYRFCRVTLCSTYWAQYTRVNIVYSSVVSSRVTSLHSIERLIASTLFFCWAHSHSHKKCLLAISRTFVRVWTRFSLDRFT